MVDQKLTDVLAALVRTKAATELPSFQQVTGLSQAILARAGAQKPWDPNEQAHHKDIRGPSFINRVLDVMSRPLYATAGIVDKELKENKDKNFFDAVKGSADILSPIAQAPAIWSGLSGKKKTTGKDILKDTGLDQTMNGPQKFAAGLGLDVGLDPLTYVGGLGLAKNLGKAAKDSTEALSTVEQGTGKIAQSVSEQISNKAAGQASKLQYEAPAPNMPAPKPTDPPRTFAAGPGTSVPEPSVAALPTPSEIPTPNLRPVLKQLEAGPTKATPPPLEALSEALGASRAGKTELKNLTKSVDEGADTMETLRALNKQIAVTKSPIAKNLLRKEAEKLQAGVKPADILSEARTVPPPFPDLTINQRWIDTAVEAAQAFMKNNRLKSINHVGQSNLYNKILHSASKVRKDRRAFTVLQMLRVAEEELLKNGRHLTDAEGISVRLSDVANISGGSRALSSELVDAFRKARPSQQLEDLKAFTTPQVASEILDPVIKAGADVAEAVQATKSPTRTVMMGSEISRELSKIAEAAGASSKEAKTAKAFIDDLFNPARDKLYSAVAKDARNLVRMSSDGILDQDTLHKISKEVYSALGENPKLLGRQVMQNRVTEGIMTKFATWWGAKDLKPFAREQIDTARNVAAAFAEAMTPLVRATKPSQREAAWQVAAGRRAASSPQEQALADQFLYLIERLMGAHGIKDNAEAVVLRSATMMKELNDELPKTLQFIEKKGEDHIGRQFDYTNGNWMHSWKEWDNKEPAEDLYQLTRAMQMVTRKNAMWDDAAIRWGMPTKGAEFQHQVTGIPRLRGTYFPEPIANQLSNLQRNLERDVFKSPHKAVEVFDKIQRMWKTGVTIYSPSHHIRNLNGDIYLAALDGVVSPKPYKIATQVMHAFSTRYKDLESVFNIMDPHLRDVALKARPGKVVLTTKKGETMTAEQIYQAAESQGLFIRAMHVEDLIGDSSPAFGTLGSKVQPFGGRVYGAATRASELRDHWVRLAHFSDILSKSKQPLRVAIEQAGRRVKKFHPDGMDLTGFEQNVLRRVIPFYSWMRKATPLVIEGAVMRPHISLAFPKVMANVQYGNGIESEGPGDPFPMDQMFPEWLKEKGIGPVLGPGSGLGRDANWRGDAPGYTIINPTQPFMDQLIQLGTPGKTAVSSLTPAARIPIELMTGQNALGIPLENVEGGVPGHLAQQIPAVGIGARLTGATRDNESWNPEQLLNWLTSAGITGTGPYEQQSQTEIREVLKKMAKDSRGDYR